MYNDYCCLDKLLLTCLLFRIHVSAIDNLFGSITGQPTSRNMQFEKRSSKNICHFVHSFIHCWSNCFKLRCTSGFLSILIVRHTTHKLLVTDMQTVAQAPTLYKIAFYLHRFIHVYYSKYVKLKLEKKKHLSR